MDDEARAEYLIFRSIIRWLAIVFCCLIFTCYIDRAGIRLNQKYEMILGYCGLPAEGHIGYEYDRVKCDQIKDILPLLPRKEK